MPFYRLHALRYLVGRCLSRLSIPTSLPLRNRPHHSRHDLGNLVRLSGYMGFCLHSVQWYGLQKAHIQAGQTPEFILLAFYDYVATGGLSLSGAELPNVRRLASYLGNPALRFICIYGLLLDNVRIILPSSFFL